MEEITAYFNTHNEHPLIVLPQLQLMYFSNDVQNGYHINPKDGRRVYQLLENALFTERGDFRAIFDANLPMFEIRSASFPALIRFIGYKFQWYDFIRCLRKTQRFIRARLLQRKFFLCPADPFGLRKIKKFMESLRSQSLPEEIVELIVTFPLKPVSNNLLHQKLPARRVETQAFQESMRFKRKPLPWQ